MAYDVIVSRKSGIKCIFHSVTRGGWGFFPSNRPIVVVTKGYHLYFLEKIVLIFF